MVSQKPTSEKSPAVLSNCLTWTHFLDISWKLSCPTQPTGVSYLFIFKDTSIASLENTAKFHPPRTKASQPALDYTWYFVKSWRPLLVISDLVWQYWSSPRRQYGSNLRTYHCSNPEGQHWSDLVQTLVGVHSLTAMHMNTNKFSRNEDKRRLTKSGEENRVFSMTSTGRRDTGETASNKSWSILKPNSDSTNI